jgi:hypothetical protein
LISCSFPPNHALILSFACFLLAKPCLIMLDHDLEEVWLIREEWEGAW